MVTATRLCLLTQSLSKLCSRALPSVALPISVCFVHFMIVRYDSHPSWGVNMQEQL